LTCWDYRKINFKVDFNTKKLCVADLMITFASKKAMITKGDVETFIRQLMQKIRTFGMVFRDDRGKNMRTLLELEITPKYRQDVIMKLQADDYIEGPLDDTLHKLGDMWVFGKDVKGRDVYIKVSKGISGGGAICISFHIAEHPLKYKFK